MKQFENEKRKIKNGGDSLYEWVALGPSIAEMQAIVIYHFGHSKFAHAAAIFLNKWMLMRREGGYMYVCRHGRMARVKRLGWMIRGWVEEHTHLVSTRAPIRARSSCLHHLHPSPPYSSQVKHLSRDGKTQQSSSRKEHGLQNTIHPNNKDLEFFL